MLRSSLFIAPTFTDFTVMVTAGLTLFLKGGFQLSSKNPAEDRRKEPT
jgi:hypothetical protein